MVIVIIALFVLWIYSVGHLVLYVCGALLSVLAGFFGMNVATKVCRTANAAMESRSYELKIAFEVVR